MCLFCREDKLVECAKSLKVNSGMEPNADLGPVISKQVSCISTTGSLGHEKYLLDSICVSIIFSQHFLVMVLQLQFLIFC